MPFIKRLIQMLSQYSPMIPSITYSTALSMGKKMVASALWHLVFQALNRKPRGRSPNCFLFNAKALNPIEHQYPFSNYLGEQAKA